MDQSELARELFDGIGTIPILDVHTHLDADHLSARGLHDILLYHMVISDLASAGCPSRSRLPEIPGEEEIEKRIEEAVAFLPYIRNTSLYWAMTRMLKDLYQWEKPIDINNWRLIDAIIKERSGDKTWEQNVMRLSGISRYSTELWRQKDGSRDDWLQYSLEWAFFTRSQWGVCDISLLELERAWNQDEPSEPLPVTLGDQRPVFPKMIKTIEDVHDAIDHYVKCIPYEQIISTAQHFSTDINFHKVGETDMSTALLNRTNAGATERDIYASYILEAFLTRLAPYGENLIYHFSIGAEPLPYETGSKLRQETIFELADVFERHPGIRFQALLSSEHTNQSFCTLAREIPNLSLAGFWWHNFFPGTIRKIINERLDMLAVNKQVGFFSDAYCLEWAYAKSFMVRLQYAEVFAQKVNQGQYTLDDAFSIARAILFETPRDLVGMIPGNIEAN